MAYGKMRSVGRHMPRTNRRDRFEEPAATKGLITRRSLTVLKQRALSFCGLFSKSSQGPTERIYRGCCPKATKRTNAADLSSYAVSIHCLHGLKRGLAVPVYIFKRR